jgi:hypothetical protein
MTDYDVAVARMLDEREAERVLDRWSIAMDRNDWKGVEACIAEEFTLLAPPVVSYADPKPRAQAVADIVARNSKVGGFHCLPAKSVTIDGDKAHAVCRLLGGHWSFDKLDWEMAYGFYLIDLVREDSRWKLSKLTVEILFSNGTGLIEKMARSAKE